MSNLKSLALALAFSGVATSLIAGGALADRNRNPTDLLYAAADPERPIWIPAERAISKDGSVNWQILGPSFRQDYENLKTWPIAVLGVDEEGNVEYDPWVSHPRPDGVYWGPTYREPVGLPAAETLDDLIANARYIIRGRVTDRKQGFFDGEPATLLTLRVSHLARPDDIARTKSAKVLHVVFPFADIQIGKDRFLKGDPSYPPAPEVGDKVMLFHFTVALDSDRIVFRPDADKIFIQPPSGELIAGTKWAKHPKSEIPWSIDDLVDRAALSRDIEVIGGAR